MPDRDWARLAFRKKAAGVPGSQQTRNPLLPVLRHRPTVLALRAVAIGLIVVVLWHDVLAALAQTAIWPADFASYYVPAHAVVQFPFTNVYDYSNLLHLNATYRYVTGVFYPYIYPPFGLILLRPLAALPFEVAANVWLVTSHLCAVGSSLLLANAFQCALARRAKDAPTGDVAARIHAVLEATGVSIGPWSFPVLPFSVVCPVMLLAWPAWDTYYFGQINFLIVMLIVLSLHAEVHERPVLAGVALALAGSLKLTPLVLLAYFMLRGAWKTVVSALGLSAILAAIPLLFFPAHDYVTMLIQLRVLDGMFVLGNHNESLIAVLPHVALVLGHTSQRVAILAENGGEGLAGALGLATLAVVLWVNVQTRARHQLEGPTTHRESEVVVYNWLEFATVLAVYVLIDPLVWSHFYVVVLPAPAMLAAYPALRAHGVREQWRQVDTVAVVAAAIGLALLMSELPLGADRGLLPTPGPLSLVLLNTRALGTLVVLGGLLFALVNESRREQLLSPVLEVTDAIDDATT